MTKLRFTPAYPAELRERGVRLLRENHSEYASDTGACEAIAPKLGCSPDSLRVWCQQAERDAGQRGGLTSAEKDRIKELEREVRELRQANEILKKASAYFAAAELDRPFRKLSRFSTVSVACLVSGRSAGFWGSHPRRIMPSRLWSAIRTWPRIGPGKTDWTWLRSSRPSMAAGDDMARARSGISCTETVTTSLAARWRG